HARANPTPEPEQPPVEVSGDVAEDLEGTWIGRPEIATIDYDITLEFTRNEDGSVNGYLVGTTFGDINQPFRNFGIEDRLMNFTMPNINPWSFTGEILDGDTLTGVLTSAQGVVKVTFSPAD